MARTIKNIFGDRSGHFAINYDDETALSFLWGYGSHTENHDPYCEIGCGSTLSDAMQRFNGPWTATTIEVMGRGEVAEKYITSRYGENPTSYTPITDLPKILAEYAEWESDDG